MQDSDKENRSFNTLAVHAGEGIGAADTRSSATPIHQTASYLLENSG